MSTARLSWPVPEPRFSHRPGFKVSPAEWWGRRFVLLVLLAWPAGLILGLENAVLVLTCAGFAAAIAGLRRPVLGLLGIGLLCTLNPVMGELVTSGDLLPFNTFNYLLVGVCLLKLPFLLRRLDPQSRVLLIFLGVLVAGVLWSPSPSAGIHICLMVLAAFGLLVYFWRGTQDDDVWQWMGLTNGFLGAAGGFVFYVEGSLVYALNANAFAYFPLTALFSIFLAFVGPVATRRRQMLLAVLAIANYGWIFLIGSRGSMLTGLCLLLFIILKLRGFHLKALLIAGGVLLCLLIVVRFSEQAAYSVGRLDRLLDPERSGRSRTSGRSDLAVAARHLFLQNPLLGTGTGGFSWYWVRIEAAKGLGNWKVGKPAAAHSGWMRTLAENGLLGIPLHAGYVVSFAVVGWKKRRQHLFLPGLIVTVTLAVAFLSTEFGGKGLWFLCAGMTVLLWRRHATSLPRNAAWKRPAALLGAPHATRRAG